VGKGRLEAFSDGVFAIVATLLVLELHVPEATDNLGLALLAQWPAYLAYLTSFATIGIIWVNHHALFERLRSVDRPLLFINLLLLLFVSLIPFPTALVGRYAMAGADSHVAAAVYGGVMVLVAVGFNLLWLRVTPRAERREGLLFSTGLLIYTLGIALSFVSAVLGLVVYALMAVFYVFPWLPRAARQ
jgi:uncharacterized membrane protein